MSKIVNDKYYTSIDLANYCWDKAIKIIGEENISEIIEPSCGDGAFYHHSKYAPHFGYDIEPECKFHNVIKADYLQQNITYLEGRLIIGNPPYGTRNTMSVKFYKQSIKCADYIAFILPISQLNNNQQMYEFDLIYSEDLGEKLYSNRKLQCCFNIYKRPKNGDLNSKPKYKLKDIQIIEYRRGGNTIIPTGYDYAMGSFGAGCVGKPIDNIGQYALECYFYINNNELKQKILTILKETNWKNIGKGISDTYRLPQWKIYKYIKEKIPEIE